LKAIHPNKKFIGPGYQVRRLAGIDMVTVENICFFGDIFHKNTPLWMLG
jgi:hypothetical protein